MTGMAALETHMAGGLTTVCRCWAITRTDGRSFGFTDHDRPLGFDGLTFRADTGLSARVLSQSSGLAVDNTEALGALSDASVTEADIEAGRFDGAEVCAWLVNWADVVERALQFRGTIGELRRNDGVFHAELRGLTEVLNRPIGRVFQKPCTAVLGDRACGVDLAAAGLTTDLTVDQVSEARLFRWADIAGFEADWFARGRLTVLSGAAQGLWGMIRGDRIGSQGREIELWGPIRGAVAPGDRVRLSAGCDRRMETCRAKFDNVINYQGFPDIPSEDWVMAYPRSGDVNSGGSRR
ncbi:MAG: DUF2163 domain-containing protein [Marinibacterium sp.]|nr:DUF2163 domain-containing protein [Marinibacterium sp.]